MRVARKYLAVGAAVMLAIFAGGTAAAHPLGNFSVNHYSLLTVASSSVGLQYILEVAEIPTYQQLTVLDRDNDGKVSSEERAAYLDQQAVSLVNQLRLTFDGRQVSLRRTSGTLDLLAGQGGLQTMRIVLDFQADVPAGGQPIKVSYHDGTYADRAGWSEVIVRGESGVGFLSTDAPDKDITHGLTEYPDDMLTSPLVRRDANFTFQVGAANTADRPQSAAVAVAGAATDAFAALIAQDQQGPGFIAVALLTALGLGALHALSPGHGKTVVAAYLVGSRGTARHALFLGSTVTVTHTIGVFALGLVTLFLSAYILPEKLYPVLELVSGLLVVGIGLGLVASRLRGVFGPPRDSAHEHHHDHHDHAAGDHDHVHNEEGLVSHTHGGRTHSHLPPGGDGSPFSWRSLLALGISGGLLPCPSALVVLLSAIALHRVGFGMLLIVAFSIGLAGVLTGLGLLMVHAKRLFSWLPADGRLVRLVPVASAGVIVVAGLAITLGAFEQARLIWG